MFISHYLIAIQNKVRDWKEKQNRVKTGEITEEEAKGKKEEALFSESQVNTSK